MSPEFGGGQAQVTKCCSGSHCMPSPAASQAFAQNISIALGGPEQAISIVVNPGRGR